jgi:hypothetical protein
MTRGIGEARHPFGIEPHDHVIVRKGGHAATQLSTRSPPAAYRFWTLNVWTIAT